MRKLFFIALFSILSLSTAMAGEIELPEAVKKNFEVRFPNASNIRWDGDSDTHYEVGFVMEGKEKIAVFLPDGTFKEIETEIKSNEIPKRVLKAIDKKFPLSTVTFALKIQRSNNSTVYELEVNTGLEEIDITLDPMGYEVD